jgi:hypothetical protein
MEKQEDSMHIQQLMGMAPFRKKKPSDFSWDAK